MESGTSVLHFPRHHSLALRQADLPTCQPYCLDAPNQSRACPILLRPPIAQTGRRWYRNINLLSIAYAFRPRLRSRLTLSRLALLRNPWAFGGGVSHSSFVTRASILTSQRSTAGLSPPLHRPGNAPLPLRASSKSVASVPSLSPVTLSAPDHLTSELLRTLLMMAASKPTSWLSLQSDIVSHLAWN